MDSASIVLAGCIAAVTAYYAFRKPIVPDVHAFQLNRQSDISKTRNKGESGIIRSRLAPHGTPLQRSSHKDVYTIYELFAKTVEKFGDAPHLGKRVNDGPYTWESFKQGYNRAKDIGSGIVQTCTFEKDQFVGLYCRNRAEWCLTDLACVFYNIPTTVLYDTLDSDSIKFILNNTNVVMLFIETSSLPRVLELKDQCPKLQHIVLVDTDKIPKLDSGKIKLHVFAEIEALGKQNPRELNKPGPKDVFTVCYTSGTTGVPKGAIISHENMVAVATGVLSSFEKLNLNNEDCHISYLPLAHSLERAVFHGLSQKGIRIGFYRGQVTQLFDDIAELKPTIFITVPRLVARLRDRVIQVVSSSSPIQKLVFEYAVAQKTRLLRQGVVTKDTIWDKYILNKVTNKTGGKIRAMLIGSAPSSPESMDFLRAVFGCQVFEGYGQTECTAGATATQLGDYQYPFGSHVGVPFPCCEIKLVDVPDMNFMATDLPNPRGELCIRGWNVVKGYWNDEANTRKIIDAEGWLHTGDVGELLPNGTIRLIDRTKSLFKLAQGEYVSPEKGESAYQLSIFVSQIYVHGDPIKSKLVALVNADFGAIDAWAKVNDTELAALTHDEMAKSEKLNKLLVDDLTRLGKQHGFNSFEVPKAVFFVREPFSPENGMLTPTMKFRRHLVAEKYRNEIDEMYRKLGE